MRVACLPPSMASKLENIFLFSLLNTLDRNTFQLKIIFIPIIEELKFLETEGITVNISNRSIKIFFKLVVILGDNLGLHTLLGLVESFSANYCCRFCLTLKEDMYLIVREEECILRTIENYEIALSTIGDSVSSFGVKEECIFHELPNFHMTKNPSVDILHDWLEGIVKNDLAKS